MPERAEQPERPDTVLGVLRAATTWLQARGVDAPRLSVELLMARVLDTTRLELYLAHDRPMSEAERDELRTLIAKRGQQVPVAYLLGDAEFRDVELTVTKDVLVPRPETESLVDMALEAAPENARCIDLGTGSGAIAVSLAAERDDLEVWAVEVDPRAAEVARQNVERRALGARVRVMVGSWWDPVRELPPFHLAVSNPPYVDPSRPELLAPDVRRHEPHRALFTRADDPASAYREILAGMAGRVVSGGVVLFETGVGASEAAFELMKSSPLLDDVVMHLDLAGIDRYLSARVR